MAGELYYNNTQHIEITTPCPFNGAPFTGEQQIQGLHEQFTLHKLFLLVVTMEAMDKMTVQHTFYRTINYRASDYWGSGKTGSSKHRGSG